MFWADQIVDEIIAKKKAPYHVYDWWTPSGLAHAGHVRTFLLHQAIYLGLKMRGLETQYFYGFDDIDPMDGFPPGLPEDYRQYMGVSLSKIPSPVEGHASLGHYYASEYLRAMEILDIHPEVPRTTEWYEAGTFNDSIRIVLDNAVKIRTIYKELGSERADDFYAFQVVCENCGKIGTTRVYDWDGTVVSYKCEPKLVTWAEGCGHEGKVDPFDGRGKLPWKPEWAAKWAMVPHYAYEGGGKDHYTKNGSRDYARRIVQEVFNAEEPIGYPHEFFLVGGKKMASSKGLGLSAVQAVQSIPAQLMRFFVYRVEPKKQLEFNLEGDSIPKIYDEYDRAITLLKTEPESNEARALVYAHQSDTPLPEYVLRFSKVVYIVQMPHMNIMEMAEKEKGSPLTDADKAELTERSEYAKKWLAEFADDTAKFTLQEMLPSTDLSEAQKAYLTALNEKLTVAEWDGGAIHTALHETKESLGLSPRDAFSALYRIFLNKEQGPQAGWFLASLDKDFVLNRLTEATK